MQRPFIFGLILVLVGIFGVLMSFMGNDPHTSALGGTPRPSPTASTTPVPHLELPEWVTDPAVNVFVAFTYTEEDSYPVRPTLFNVDSGERFYIDWSHVDDMRWYELDGRVYLQLERFRSSGADNSDGFLEVVDTTTTQLTRYTLDDLARPDRQIALPTPPVDNGNGFHYEISDDGEVSIVSLAGIVPLELPTISENYRRIEAKWHGDYLHVWYWDYPENYTVERGDAIYRTNGDILMQFEETPIWANGDTSLLLFRREDRQYCLLDVTIAEPDCGLFSAWEAELGATMVSVAWTPDNQEILVFYRIGASESGGLCRYLIADGSFNCIWEHTIAYTPFSAGVSSWLDESRLIFTYRNVVNGTFDTRSLRDNGLCILQLETNTVQCPTEGALPPDTFYYFTVLSPLQDKMAIAYTGQEYAGQDGLCLYDFELAETSCPVTAEDLGGWYIEEVGWSPDGRHLVVMYGPYGQLSDDKSFTKMGFVDVETSTYRDEGYANLEHNLAPLWRP